MYSLLNEIKLFYSLILFSPHMCVLATNRATSLLLSHHEFLPSSHNYRYVFHRVLGKIHWRRPSSWWCPATWCVVTIGTKRTFDPQAYAFRHERRVGHSFLREEKRSGRISPTQKTTAFLISRESFFPLSRIFLLSTTVSYDAEKSPQNARWIGTDRSHLDRRDIVRRKKKKNRSIWDHVKNGIAHYHGNTGLNAKPFGAICVRSMHIAGLECVTAPNLLPLSVLTEFT